MTEFSYDAACLKAQSGVGFTRSRPTHLAWEAGSLIAGPWGARRGSTPHNTRPTWAIGAFHIADFDQFFTG